MRQEKSVGYRFAMLLLLMITGAMLGYIVALASIPLVFQIPFSALMDVLNMDSGLDITPAVLKYVQLILATFVFIVPANAYSHLFSDNPFVFFEFKKPSLLFLFFAALLWLFTLPIISFLADINNKIAFPASFAGLENSFRLAEARAENATRFLLNITSLSGLMVNLLVIAVVAAIAEELIFRGIIQKLLFEQSKNIHLAIWLTALVFSLFHLQFFAIIPRIVLGAALGYTFFWSKSIWVPIFFHFINNASIVFASYLYQKKLIATDPNEITFFSNSVLFVAFICSIAMVYFWSKRAK
jgi:membrane protease YdiL (CAAX protease family)